MSVRVQQGSGAIHPLLSSSFPQSSGASAWPPGKGFYVRGMSDRKQWPSSSVSVLHNAYQTGKWGIFYLQSHHCYVYEAYWYGPDAGKQLPRLFLFEDKSAFILTLSTSSSPPSFQTFKAGNLDGRSVSIQHYRLGRKQAFWPVRWGSKKGSAERER